MKRRGFTLIELMIVVVIIGILAAIAIPKFGAVKEQAERASCRSNMRSIASAEAMYLGQNEVYGSIASLSGPGGMMENANAVQCPSNDANYVVTPAAGPTYDLPCPYDPSVPAGHGSITDGVISWQ